MNITFPFGLQSYFPKVSWDGQIGRYTWVYVNKIQTLYICARYLFIEGLDFFCDFGSQPAAHIEELKSIGIAMQPAASWQSIKCE